MQKLQQYMNNQKLDEQKFQQVIQQVQDERLLQMDMMQDKHLRDQQAKLQEIKKLHEDIDKQLAIQAELKDKIF